jgi:hypothetical protein
MSRTYKDSPQGRRQPRRVSVRAVRRDPPDTRALRRALVEQALAAAETEAAYAHPQDERLTDNKEHEDV